MKFNSFYFLVIVALVLIFSLCFFVPIFSSSGYISTYVPNSSQSPRLSLSTNNFAWPVPGYNTITSNFGYRKSPTSGAGSYHGGIDIAVPPGTNIISVSSGIVTYLGFYGANGFTVKIESGNLVFIYSHVAPNFLVYTGQVISKGQVIAKVGPKNVYGVLNNPYKDSTGNPTNRCNYRSSSSFCNKKRRQSRQSFKLFLITYLLRHLHHHSHNVNIHVHNNRHFLRSHLPNLILLCYCILDILFRLLSHHSQLQILHYSMDK